MGNVNGPRDTQSPGTKGREQQPWPACSWGLPRPSDSGRSLRGQLQEDTHDLGGGTSSARLRSVRLTPGDYYGSQSVRSGHFCWSKWGKIGRVDTKRGVAYDRSKRGCLLLRRPQKAHRADSGSLLHYQQGLRVSCAVLSSIASRCWYLFELRIIITITETRA